MNDKEKKKIKDLLERLFGYADELKEECKFYIGVIRGWATENDLLPKAPTIGQQDSYGYGYGHKPKPEPEPEQQPTKAEMVADLDGLFKDLLALKDQTPKEVDDAIDWLNQYYIDEFRPSLEENQVQKAAAINEVKEALKILNQYKNDFPDELKAAIGIVAEYAVAQVNKDTSDEGGNEDNEDD